MKLGANDLKILAEKRESNKVRKEKPKAVHRTPGIVSVRADEKGYNRTTIGKRYRRYLKAGLSHEEALEKAVSYPPMGRTQIGQCGARQRYNSLKNKSRQKPGKEEDKS